jgi:hypothetical protein
MASACSSFGSQASANNDSPRDKSRNLLAALLPVYVRDGKTFRNIYPTRGLAFLNPGKEYIISLPRTTGIFDEESNVLPSGCHVPTTTTVSTTTTPTAHKRANNSVI